MTTTPLPAPPHQGRRPGGVRPRRSRPETTASIATPSHARARVVAAAVAALSAFLRTDPVSCVPFAFAAFRCPRRSGGIGNGIGTSSTRRGMSKISRWNDDYEEQMPGDDNDDDDGLITKEKFLRDMLADPPTVRRKKKGDSEYKSRNRPHDNRDALPFVVKVQTPDPYTSPDEMLRQAKRASEAETNKQRGRGEKGGDGGGGGRVNGKKKGSGTMRRSNLVGMDGPNGIAASIFARERDGSLHKVLGEFDLDKNTNCGDLIEVGEREFEVVKARAQFKYAGGKRFVMVRKILEVKELTRIAEEESLKRAMMRSGGDGGSESDGPNLE